MAIHCFLKKIVRKISNFILCYVSMIRLYPIIEQYNHRLQLEEAICYDINKVIIKIEKKINAKRK